MKWRDVKWSEVMFSKVDYNEMKVKVKIKV